MLDRPLGFADYERHLAASLPSYMRPHRVYLVDALPLTANGKVDARRAAGPRRPAVAGLG